MHINPLPEASSYVGRLLLDRSNRLQKNMQHFTDALRSQQVMDCIENGSHWPERYTGPRDVFECALQFVWIWVLRNSLSVKSCMFSSIRLLFAWLGYSSYFLSNAFVNSATYWPTMLFPVMGSLILNRSDVYTLLKNIYIYIFTN